jgi:hypothetical protein
VPERLAWAVLRWLPAKSVLPVSIERKTLAIIGGDIHTGVIWLYHQRPDVCPAASTRFGIQRLMTES